MIFILTLRSSLVEHVLCKVSRQASEQRLEPCLQHWLTDAALQRTVPASCPCHCVGRRRRL